MYSIPKDALYFGGQGKTEHPISYDKTRVSGSASDVYILHSKAGCMPGQKEIFTINSRSKVDTDSLPLKNKITRAYKRERYKELKPSIRLKSIKGFSDSFTYEEYAPFDDETLNLAIRASYNQVFGNFKPMESEREIDLERRLRNGDLPIREFIRGLAKSDFYRSNYFEVVTQQRCIELNFKHLLGRAPFDQSELIAHTEMLHSEGINYHIDSLIDSIEYEEFFGSDTVPYSRCWNSPCGITTSSFVHIAMLERSFATSDNAIHERITIPEAPGGSSQLIRSLAGVSNQEIKVPYHVDFVKKETLIQERTQEASKIQLNNVDL